MNHADEGTSLTPPRTKDELEEIMALQVERFLTQHASHRGRSVDDLKAGYQ
jgi:hypothetical protein